MPGDDHVVSTAPAENLPPSASGRDSAGAGPASPVPVRSPRGPAPAAGGPRRRDFFRYSGGVAAAGAIAGSGLLAAAPAQALTGRADAAQAGRAADAAATAPAGYAAANGNLLATPIRPPAAPLAVRSPYVSTWLPATALAGTWQELGCR